MATPATGSAGNGSPASRSRIVKREREIAARAVAADRDVVRGDALLAQPAPGRERVLVARRGTDARARADIRPRACASPPARPASVTMRRWLTIEPEQ